MAQNITDIATLKSYFQKGDRPTEEQFGELIDSMLHRDEAEGLGGLEEYTITKSYEKGDTVVYNGCIYIAREESTNEDFNCINWFKLGSAALYEYPAFISRTNYDTDETPKVVRFNFGLYKYKGGFAMENSESLFALPSNAAYWQSVKIQENTFGETWAANTYYLKNSVVLNSADNKLYKLTLSGNINFIESTDFATEKANGKWVEISSSAVEAFNQTNSYQDGSMVVFDGKIYEAKIDIPAGTPFSPNNWTMIGNVADGTADGQMLIWDNTVGVKKWVATSGLTLNTSGEIVLDNLKNKQLLGTKGDGGIVGKSITGTAGKIKVTPGENSINLDLDFNPSALSDIDITNNLTLSNLKNAQIIGTNGNGLTVKKSIVGTTGKISVVETTGEIKLDIDPSAIKAAGTTTGNVQFRNASGNFEASSNLVWNNTANQLNVAGNIQSNIHILNTQANVATPLEGMIRWNGTNYQGYKGTAWVNLDDTSGGGSTDPIVVTDLATPAAFVHTVSSPQYTLLSQKTIETPGTYKLVWSVEVNVADERNTLYWDFTLDHEGVMFDYYANQSKVINQSAGLTKYEFRWPPLSSDPDNALWVSQDCWYLRSKECTITVPVHNPLKPCDNVIKLFAQGWVVAGTVAYMKNLKLTLTKIA